MSIQVKLARVVERISYAMYTQAVALMQRGYWLRELAIEKARAERIARIRAAHEAVEQAREAARRATDLIGILEHEESQELVAAWTAFDAAKQEARA